MATKVPSNISQWYGDYSKALSKGTANKDLYGWYNNYSKQYGLAKTAPTDDVLRNLSLKSLSGDKNASEYLKWTEATPLQGEGLWKNFDPANGAAFDKLSGWDTTRVNDNWNKRNALESQYMKDNPWADYSVNYDNKQRTSYEDMINNNKPMSDWQLQWYQDMIQRRHIEDMNDPFVQQRDALKKDKQSALNAQDIALNQGMSQMDANSFQQMQGLQQQMSERGMGDSGIAADAYMRATMGNNQNYQQAFSDAATNKSGIQKTYDDALSKSKLDQQDYNDSRIDTAYKQALDAQNAQTELFKAQSDADKNMTDSTGIVYVNGKPMVDSNGHQVSSMEYMKLSETQRHNLAEENNVAIGNSLQYSSSMDANSAKRQGDYYNYLVGMDRNSATREGDQLQYTVGMDANNVSRIRISADINIAAEKLKYNYASLDLRSQQVQADINNAAAKLDIMARDSSNKELSAKAGILKAQLVSVQSNINAYVKAGKTPPDDLKTKLQSIAQQMGDLAAQGK